MGTSLWVVLVLVAGLGFPRHADAQLSVWLPKGVSGAGGEAGVQTSNVATDFVVFGGYSYRGFLEFDLGFHYVIYNDDELVPDVTAVGLSPGLQIHPLKQDAGMPISLGLSAQLMSLAASSPALDDTGLELNALGVSLAAAVYRFISLGTRMSVTPSVGVTFSHLSATLRNSSGTDINEDDDTSVAAALAGNFAYLTSSGVILGLTPSLNVGGNLSFGLMFGVIGSVQHR